MYHLMERKYKHLIGWNVEYSRPVQFPLDRELYESPVYPSMAIAPNANIAFPVSAGAPHSCCSSMPNRSEMQQFPKRLPYSTSLYPFATASGS